MSTIAMTNNPIFHSFIKHIQIGHHFIWELMNKEEFGLEFCKNGEQLADIFIEPISIEKFNKLREMLRVYDFSRLRGSVKNQD